MNQNRQFIIPGRSKKKVVDPMEATKVAPARLKVVGDPDICSGCRLCEMVCSLSHEGEVNPSLSRIRISNEPLYGKNTRIAVCHQCRAPNCMVYCPKDAIEVDRRTGARIINEEKCIGCLICSRECYLSEVWLNKNKKKAYKCDLCGGDPLCVKFCPQKALEVCYEPPSNGSNGFAEL